MSAEVKESAPQEGQSTKPATETFYVHASEKKREPYEALLANLFFANGRFSRESFWVVYLGCMLAALISPLLGSILFWPFVIALTWVSMAAVIKRFHDRGKSGVWWLVSLIPFAGTIWILVECGLLAGDHAPNQYGQRALGPKDLLK